jgi:hypothetical protein
MKSVQKFTSIFLVAAILVSSLGFTANKMVCLKSGETKLSLVNIKDCCPDEEAEAELKADCCDITNTFFDLNDFVQSEKSELVQPLAIQSFCVDQILSFRSLSKSQKLIISFADLPPPLYGRALLNYISILII